MPELEWKRKAEKPKSRKAEKPKSRKAEKPKSRKAEKPKSKTPEPYRTAINHTLKELQKWPDVRHLEIMKLTVDKEER